MLFRSYECDYIYSEEINMGRFAVKRITILSYLLFLMSVVWLGLAIAEIVLERRVRSVFRDLRIQLPGTNKAERLFVFLDPPNIDDGPSIAMLSASTLGVIASTLGVIWMVALWFDLKVG